MNQTPISSMRVCVCVNGSFEKMRSYSRNKYFHLLMLLTSHFTKIADGNSKLEWNLALSFSARDATCLPFSSEKSTTVTNIPFFARARLSALPTYQPPPNDHII